MSRSLAAKGYRTNIADDNELHDTNGALSCFSWRLGLPRGGLHTDYNCCGRT